LVDAGCQQTFVHSLYSKIKSGREPTENFLPVVENEYHTRLLSETQALTARLFWQD
jgi:hypothetical protein